MHKCGSCQFFIKWKNNLIGGGLCESLDTRTKADYSSRCKQFKRKKYIRTDEIDLIYERRI